LLLDTTHNIATPEGVELRLPVAGLAARAIAWLIDGGIKLVVIWVLALIMSFVGRFGWGLMYAGLFAALWFYNVLFEVLNHGATPGKKAVDIRVVNINGTPVGWSGSLLRNLIRFVDALPGVYLFGCISVLLSDKFQRIGDLAAGTIVVHNTKHWGGTGLGNTQPIAVKVPLTLDEQQAIVSFGERASKMNAERNEELASLLEPVFGDIDAARLRGHASWLAGGERQP
jgi:uncharacterized RDD family membrane protein YckC